MYIQKCTMEVLVHVLGSPSNLDVNLGDSCEPYNTYGDPGRLPRDLYNEIHPTTHLHHYSWNLWTWQRAGNKIHGVRKNKSKGASSWAGWLTFLTCVLNVSRRWYYIYKWPLSSIHNITVSYINFNDKNALKLTIMFPIPCSSMVLVNKLKLSASLLLG